jgi:type I restriction enzyme S subunit
MSCKTTTTITKEGVTSGLVPKLRFPEFLEAEAWKGLPLSELVVALDAGVSVNSGDRPATQNEVGVLKTSAVTNGVFEPQENKVVFDEMERGRVKEPVQGGTIIISRMNTPALVGANAFVEASLDNIYLPDRLWAAKAKPGTSMRFVASILGSDKGRAALSKLAKGSSGSMKNITKPDVLAFLIVAPSPAEQHKIAECLSSVDELIAAQARKVDALKSLKKGLMQQLFPREGEIQPRLRFPEFQNAGEWEAKRLDELVDIQSGATPSKANLEFWKGSVPWVSAKDMKRLFLEDAEDHISTAAIENGARLVPPGTLLVLTRGMTLHKDVPICVLRREMSFNQDVKGLRPKDGVDGLFLAWMLTGNKARLLAMVDIAGHGTGKLGTDELKGLGLMLPRPPEQLRIADCLSSLDDLIAVQTLKHNALKTHKKGLMQHLFPSLQEVEA